MTISLSAVSGINIDLFLMVFMRMSGAFIFNPILGRENVPVTLRAALGFLCALVITPTMTGVSVNIGGLVQLMVMSLSELFIGIVLGVIVTIIIFVVQLAGEQIDMQMGLAMSKTYDAKTGVSMPIMGSLFNLIMIFCFFASNAHLTLITFISDSFKLIAPGAFFPTQSSMQFIVNLGKDYFELGLRMALPIIAVEVVCQIAIGLLMRAVPSINVFSVGLQLQLLVGLVVVVITITSIVAMCEQLTTFMLEKAAQIIRIMGAGA